MEYVLHGLIPCAGRRNGPHWVWVPLRGSLRWAEERGTVVAFKAGSLRLGTRRARQGKVASNRHLVSLFDDEEQRIQERAAIEGVTVSRYLADVAMGRREPVGRVGARPAAVVAARPVTELLVMDLRGALKLFAKVSVNLNQIARHLNGVALSDDPGQVRDAIVEERARLNAVLDGLARHGESIAAVAGQADAMDGERR